MIIAKAHPNQKYENSQTFRNVILEAHFQDKKIIYYEIHTDDPDWVAVVSENTVFDLFGRSVRIKEKPFLKSENPEFYSVLFRRYNTTYKERYVKLFNEAKKIPVFKRTKYSFKRTK